MRLKEDFHNLICCSNCKLAFYGRSDTQFTESFWNKSLKVKNDGTDDNNIWMLKDITMNLKILAELETDIYTFVESLMAYMHQCFLKFDVRNDLELRAWSNKSQMIELLRNPFCNIWE